MIHRLKFESNTTAAIRYVEYNDENKTYSTNYYFANGGHKKSQRARLAEVKAAIERCQCSGYTRVDKCSE